MLTGNGHKNYTYCGDKDAESLLEKVLSDIGTALSGAGLAVYLGGSYGRGDGGVRQDKENGILYNDLDFFVFARKKSAIAEMLLKKIAEKYEEILKVDVDFSSIMSVKDIKKNRQRLMMQELKRGCHLVCGEDLLAEYLPEIPAEKLPFSEACRLLLNRGMGLLLAGEKIANDSSDTDFILRNINKAILGACDALLIARKNYKWSIDERLKAVNALDLPNVFKEFYAKAVEFKKSPNREAVHDLNKVWRDVRDIFKKCIEEICGTNCSMLYLHCKNSGEVTLKNLIKYCVKLRTIPEKNCKMYTIPAAAALIPELDQALENMPEKIDMKSKLYQQWLIFN